MQCDRISGLVERLHLILQAGDARGIHPPQQWLSRAAAAREAAQLPSLQNPRLNN